MNKKIISISISITLLILSPLVSHASYRMNISPQDPESIQFLTPSEVEIPESIPPVIDDPNTCSNNFPTPVMAPGYPKVIKGSNSLQYLILYTSVGNYSNQANMSSQKYPKLLLTHTTGTQHGTDSAAWGDVLTGWQVNPGETIHVVVTPASYDMEGGSVCASGTPIDLVNKTYDELLNQ